jgi:hypothetical protein
MVEFLFYIFKIDNERVMVSFGFFFRAVLRRGSQQSRDVELKSRIKSLEPTGL